MKSNIGLREARLLYAVAYGAHYETKDLGEALKLYKRILAEYPDTKEAGYSRSQIQNIVKKVVPEHELFDAQVGMAVAHSGGIDSRRERCR